MAKSDSTACGSRWIAVARIVLCIILVYMMYIWILNGMYNMEWCATLSLGQRVTETESTSTKANWIGSKCSMSRMNVYSYDCIMIPFFFIATAVLLRFGVSHYYYSVSYMLLRYFFFLSNHHFDIFFATLKYKVYYFGIFCCCMCCFALLRQFHFLWILFVETRACI